MDKKTEFEVNIVLYDSFNVEKFFSFYITKLNPNSSDNIIIVKTIVYNGALDEKSLYTYFSKEEFERLEQLSMRKYILKFKFSNPILYNMFENLDNDHHLARELITNIGINIIKEKINGIY